MTETLIEAIGLTKDFDDFRAVDAVELAVRPGEVVALLGPNGAGKTTTIEMLEGLKGPDAGEIVLLGQSWGVGQDRALREEIGIALQNTEIAERLTVEEVIRVFRSFYRKGRAIEETLRLVDLEAKRGASFMKLSGGQKQRVALACALVGSPQILFLDEPTTGLDPQARHRVWEVVEDFEREGGTVLLTTHYMDEAARLCDRIAIMDHGKIIASGTPKALIAGLDADQILEFESDTALSIEALRRLAGVQAAAQQGARHSLRVRPVTVALPALLQEIDRQGAELKSLETHEPTLEDVFVHLTGRALRDG